MTPNIQKIIPNFVDFKTIRDSFLEFQDFQKIISWNNKL